VNFRPNFKGNASVQGGGGGLAGRNSEVKGEERSRIWVPGGGAVRAINGNDEAETSRGGRVQDGPH